MNADRRSDIEHGGCVATGPAGLWRFSGKPEYESVGLPCEAETERLEGVEHRLDSRNQAGSLGIEEQSQRARQTQSEGAGGLTRHGVIADHDCVAAFQGQREHLGLTRAETRRK